jgi:hypothetical protein
MPDRAENLIRPCPETRGLTRLPIRKRSSLPTYPKGWGPPMEPLPLRQTRFGMSDVSKNTPTITGGWIVL